MTYRIELTPSARRDLQRLPAKIYPAVIEFLAGPLAANPHRVGHALRGPLQGEWSARRGTYRVRYRIEDDRVVVLVVHIAHRSDVYR